MTVEELLKQKQEHGRQIAESLNKISSEIQALTEKRQFLINEAYKNNGAIEALSQLEKT
jgi:hypothetical protein